MSQTGAPAVRTPLTAEDMLQTALIDDLALAPRGDLVAMTVRRADATANRYYSHIQIVPVDGRPAWSFPAGNYIDHAASWSPDGSQLAFLSDRAGPEQVWLATLDGRMRQLTSFPLGAGGRPVWSPDGRRLAIVVTEDLDPGMSPAPIVAADAPPFTRTRLGHRVDGKGYLGARYQHIWVVDAESGASTRLTDGPWNDATPDWSPDGSRIVYISNRAGRVAARVSLRRVGRPDRRGLAVAPYAGGRRGPGAGLVARRRRDSLSGPPPRSRLCA